MMVLSLATAVAAVPVLGIAACRMFSMGYKTHKAFWPVIYFLMSAGAFLAIGELFLGRGSWSAVILMAAIACYLWASRVTWRNGPPRFTLR